jgi:hypothetical protein
MSFLNGRPQAITAANAQPGLPAPSLTPRLRRPRGGEKNQHPKVASADWYDAIKNRLNLLWPDQVHPVIPGTMVYARVVDQAVQATRQPPGSAPAERNAVAGTPGS